MRNLSLLRRARLRLMILILCLAAHRLCQAQIGFNVSPAKLYFSPRGASEQTLRLHLANPMNTRLVLQATCADWRRDSLGDKVYFPAGTLPASCCSQIKVTPAVIELAPGEKRDILVTLVAAQPEKAAGAIRNGMLLLTQSNEHEVAQLKGTSQFIIKAQIGVHLYVLPDANLQPDIAITSMNAGKSGEQRQVKINIHNSGRTLMESLLRVEYLNLETMEELKPDPIPVNTLPGDAFAVITAVPPSLPVGKYLIVAVLDSGPRHPLKVAELEAMLK
jgi:hypothetical protein